MKSTDIREFELSSVEENDWHYRMFGVQEAPSGSVTPEEWQEYVGGVRAHFRASRRLQRQILKDIAKQGNAKGVSHE